MRDKNIKKHPSAQALSDDSLENVAGGWNALGGSQGGFVYEISKKERKKLKKYGFSYKKSDDWKDLNIQTYTITDNFGNPASYRDIERILGAES